MVSTRCLRALSAHPLLRLTALSALCTALLLSVTASAADKKASAKKTSTEKSAKKEAPEPEPEPEPESEPESADAADDGSSSGAESDAAGGAAAAGAAAAGAGAFGELGSTVIFFDAGVRSDSGTYMTREEVGRNSTTNFTDIKSSGPLMHIGFVTKIFGPIRVGGAVGYAFNYNLKQRLTPEEEEQEDFEALYLANGQLWTGDLRVEFSPRLADRFYLIVQPVGGVSWIQVGGDLQTVTSELEESHVIRKPRLGWQVGGELGLRYRLTPWASLRGTAGLGYFSQSLLKATRRGDAADSVRTQKVQSSRFTGALGVEANF